MMKVSALIAATLLAALGSGVTLAETKIVTSSGEIVSYQAGKYLVIRGDDNMEHRYTLAPTVTVPSDLKVGQQAMVYTEPGPKGSDTVVTRVTTTSVAPDGQTKQTVEETRSNAYGTTKSTTTVSGKVEAYEVGKKITVLRDDGSRVSYVINPNTSVASGVAVGETVTLVPVNENARVVRTITIGD